MAKRRLPRAVFDYIDGGADAEITLRENCRAFERRHVPSALARSRRRRATCGTTVLGTTARAAVHPRAGRQQPHVLSARRRGGRARRRRGRHDLHPLDAVGLPARGRARRRRAGRPGTSSISSAAATSRWRRSTARAGRRLLARSSSPSTRRSPACASATCATASKELRHAESVDDAAVRLAVPRAAAMARRLPRATAG